NVAIARLMAVFGAATDEVQWVVTGYMLVMAVVVPASGWLGDTFGYKRVYMGAMAVFTVGSALCMLAWSIDSLVAFRVVQGIGGGVIMPATMAMIYAIVPRERIGTAMGLWGIGAMAGPAIGPTLGGYLVEQVNWESIFAINVPIGIAGIVLAAFLLPERRAAQPQRLDWGGLVTSAVGLCTLLLALSEGNKRGWDSPSIVFLLYTAAFSLGLFVYLELTQPEPLLDLRVFRYGTFTAGSLLIAAVMIGMFAGVFYIPLFLQNVQGLSPMHTGLLLMPAALATAVTAPVGGRLYDRVGARPLVIPGLAILAVTTYMLHGLTADFPQERLVRIMALRGVGMGLLMMPATAASMSVIPPHLVGRASAVNNIVQRVSGSFGLAVLTSLLQRWQALYANEMAASVTAGSPLATLRLEPMARGLQAALGLDPDSARRLATLQLWGQIQQAAFVRAVQDLFVVAAAVAALSLLPALFLKEARGARTAPGPQPRGERAQRGRTDAAPGGGDSPGRRDRRRVGSSSSR
ncbi:MAG: DHA2 family efflux MFS transporter permease subunit, partial [Clostridia bacterium]|nr:DHA2 family efflux MFS transporter permease subunit [Clostridia bacterium]